MSATHTLALSCSVVPAESLFLTILRVGSVSAFVNKLVALRLTKRFGF